MFSKSHSYALIAALLLSHASAQDIATPTYSGPINEPKYQGCFSSSEPLTDHGSYTFQTKGNCQPICLGLGKPVMALVNGSNCFCGDLLPAANSKVSERECDTPCQGFDQEMCGGNEKWMVYLTQINKNKIDNYDPKNPDQKKPKVSSAAVVTVSGSIVQVTVGPTASGEAPSQSGKPNTVGIAAGVVAGVVVLAGIVGGVFFYLRLRRRKQAKEEYRSQVAVKEFFAGGKPPGTGHSSLNDSRLDPEAVMRRESVGSLADNHDYSRKILKVTNPDGY